MPPEIDPDNAAAWGVFAAASTQWRFAGMNGVPVGLDYNAVEILRRAHGVDGDVDFWERVRVLESEALDVMQERLRG